MGSGELPPVTDSRTVKRQKTAGIVKHGSEEVTQSRVSAKDEFSQPSKKRN